MKISYSLFPYMAILLIIISAGCQKVINIDLNSASPKVVIEGEINEGNTAQVFLSQTVNFSDSIYFKGLNGALITVTDNSTGTIDTLRQVNTGVYIGNSLFAQIGHTYTLLVKTGGKVYTAISTVPTQVVLDSVYTINFGGFGGNKNLVLVPKFTQPYIGKHYYRFNYSTNGQPQGGFYLRDNLLTPGQVSTSPLGGREGAATVKPGDQVELTMRCVDEAVYNYFSTLEQNTSSGSATPANPVSNLSNGALGYFSANTIQLYYFMVK